jgi:hypothetical protein
MLAQRTCSKQKSHTIREHLWHIIENVRKECSPNDCCFLWDGLRQTMKSPEVNIEQCTTYIREWIAKVSKQIHCVLLKNQDKIMMSDESQDYEKWQVLFRNKVRKGKNDGLFG